ncbi:NADH dehydrogenase [ubiquinone] 1 alpha subcomplex assembly factor 3 isoform X2 [Mustelus asterias]
MAAAALCRRFESRLRLWSALGTEALGTGALGAGAQGAGALGAGALGAGALGEQAWSRTPARQPCRGYKMTPSDDELYQRTRVNALERESQDMMFIDGYSRHGFTVNGNRVFGPCAVIPQAIVQWNVGSYKDINEDSLALFYILEPKIEILVLGMGDRIQRLDPKLLVFMKSKGIAVEVQDTVSEAAQTQQCSSKTVRIIQTRNKKMSPIHTLTLTGVWVPHTLTLTGVRVPHTLTLTGVRFHTR